MPMDAPERMTDAARRLADKADAAVEELGDEQFVATILPLADAVRCLAAVVDGPAAAATDGAAAPAPRSDGLTDAEGVVMDALCAAVNAFGRLGRQHPDEMRDFVDGIHRCQDQLAVRIARRAFPVGWPTHGA